MTLLFKAYSFRSSIYVKTLAIFEKTEFNTRLIQDEHADVAELVDALASGASVR